VGSTEELSVVSFCSGYGGIEGGLDLAGVNHRVIAYVEIEAFAIANLVAKMEQGKLAPAPIWTNLKTFPAHLFRGSIDIITGGYPCQPFSAAGRRKGDEDPRHLWPYIREHVKVIKPRSFLFENVEGHISLGLSSVISDMKEDGYDATWGIFSAEEVGAPHRRKRVFILGNSEHNGLFRSEKPGSIVSTSNNHTQGTQETSESSGTSRSNVSGDIQESELAYTQSKRVQGLRTSGEQESKTHGGQEVPMCGSQRPGYAHWKAEPDVGRVVDGSSDRVDRIRMLGNGVVPQTACRAWQVLTSKFIYSK
jgi:DNA (cytosine-5)-methyltransferase 1